MDSDLVLEVPDTPERLAQLGNESEKENMRHFLAGNSSRLTLNSTGERDVSTKYRSLDDAKLPANQGILSQLKSETLDKQHPLISPLEFGQSGVSSDNTDTMEKAGLISNVLTIPNGSTSVDSKRKQEKRLRSESSKLLRNPGNKCLLGIGSTPPSISVGHSQNRNVISLSDEDNAVLPYNSHSDLKSMDKGNGVSLCSGLNSESNQELGNAVQIDIPQRPRKLRRLVRNGCISPYNIERTANSSDVPSRMISDGQRCSSFAIASGQDKLKEKVILEEQPKNSKRKLVRNGCVLQSNNSESSSARQLIEDEAKVMEFRSPNGTSHQVHIISPDSSGRCQDSKNRKGKAIADNIQMTNGQYSMPKFPLSREADDNVVIDDNRNCYVLGPEDLGYRARNGTVKEPTVPLSEAVSCCKAEEASGHSSNQSNQVARGTGSENRGKKHTEGRRKYSSNSNSNGGSSSSVSDAAEISYLRTSWRPSKSRSTRTRNPRQQGIVLGPVIEIDELQSPEPISNNPQEQFDSRNARASQVKSDELFAQHLQEQLYNESGVGDRDEIDAALAWSLQQEENAQHASLASEQTQLSRRERLIARLHSRPPRRNYASRSSNSVQHGSSSRAARTIRDFDFPEIDPDMRSFVLQVQAGMFDVSRTVSRNSFHIHRDFDEDDYETLLALDDNNHQHSGASNIQINNLPQSVVQTDNIEEPCAVCLEKPSIGDTIRHLPCLHKFHKDCIDEWLRRKTACPICKNGIT
ncbi:hypothetical protein Cni_G16176 [Canna indica]|uniref:RING-type domain-containing protein n=1 Tax=Canna indica TaxID=4628 RepID=A0AAQ3KEX8_9LILI|nr:hypothetical protein Cni_G16176 [Canna indica]